MLSTKGGLWAKTPLFLVYVLFPPICKNAQTPQFFADIIGSKFHPYAGKQGVISFEWVIYDTAFLNFFSPKFPAEVEWPLWNLIINGGYSFPSGIGASTRLI